MDEFFEAVTLIQTKKINLPFILVGRLLERPPGLVKGTVLNRHHFTR